MVQARAAAQARDAHRVLWILHRLCLGLLSSQGRLEFERWKTNSDYLQECAGDDEDASLLKELTRCYEAVVYAHHEVPFKWVLDLLQQVDQKGGRA